MNNKNRSFIALAALIIIFLSVDTIDAKGKHKSDPPSLKGKKVLYVWGGWAGHEPEECRDILVPWMREEGAEVIVSDSLGIYTDEKFMASLD